MGIHLKDIIEGICRKAIQDENGKNIDSTYLKKTGDTKDNTTSFTSNDNATPTAWENVSVITSGEKHSSILNKISVMFKNIRWIYKILGSVSLSGIGTGTVTGAIATINNFVGVKNNGGSSTNIQYYYPSGDNVFTSLGAASLKVALENATKEIAEEVSSLNTDIQTLGNRYSAFNSGPNSNRKLTFSGTFSAIVSVRGPQSDAFGAFFVQGYGVGSARIHIATIQAGPSVTCTVIENEESVFLRNTSVAVSGSVFMLSGTLPVIAPA